MPPQTLLRSLAGGNDDSRLRHDVVVIKPPEIGSFGPQVLGEGNPQILD